jgi:hypothetical protein
LTIITIISYHRFPFPRYFSWTNGAPHHSSFKFQTVALCLLCAMSLVQLGVNRPGSEAEHSPLSSAEVKNAWSYTSTPQYVFMV